ncbi:hypothetical protein Tco_0670034 [Tanacetum coccineum]
MQAAVHEIGPPGDGATISDGGVAVFDHSNILAILSSSSLAIFSASSVVPGRDADVVVVTTTNIKIASFSKGMSWTHGAQTPIVAHGTVSNCSRARTTTRRVIGLHLFTPVPAFPNILTAPSIDLTVLSVDGIVREQRVSSRNKDTLDPTSMIGQTTTFGTFNEGQRNITLSIPIPAAPAPGTKSLFSKQAEQETLADCKRISHLAGKKARKVNLLAPCSYDEGASLDNLERLGSPVGHNLACGLILVSLNKDFTSFVANLQYALAKGRRTVKKLQPCLSCMKNRCQRKMLILTSCKDDAGGF